MLLLLNFFRVKRCYMINNTFCIYQNNYNNTLLDDKMYRLTVSAFFFVLKRCYLSNSTFLYLTHNFFMYKNVSLVHIYVTFLHTDITFFHRDVIFLQRCVANLHTCHILTLQVSHYFIQMSDFYITKSHPYRQIRDSYILYMSHSNKHMLYSYLEMSHS